jgi:molecular chaperone IbpA
MYKTEIEKHFDKLFVGFDNFYNLPALTTKLEYPRYNIGKHDTGYEIMVALPGWSKEAVSIELHDGNLTVKGVKQEETTKVNWVHKGISGKAFEKAFKVDTALEVKKASLVDGMLHISLEYTPSSKPVTIPVE